MSERIEDFDYRPRASTCVNDLQNTVRLPKTTSESAVRQNNGIPESYSRLNVSDMALNELSSEFKTVTIPVEKNHSSNLKRSSNVFKNRVKKGMNTLGIGRIHSLSRSMENIASPNFITSEICDSGEIGDDSRWLSVTIESTDVYERIWETTTGTGSSTRNSSNSDTDSIDGSPKLLRPTSVRPSTFYSESYPRFTPIRDILAVRQFQWSKKLVDFTENELRIYSGRNINSLTKVVIPTKAILSYKTQEARKSHKMRNNCIFSIVIADNRQFDFGVSRQSDLRKWLYGLALTTNMDSVDGLALFPFKSNVDFGDLGSSHEKPRYQNKIEVKSTDSKMEPYFCVLRGKSIAFYTSEQDIEIFCPSFYFLIQLMSLKDVPHHPDRVKLISSYNTFFILIFDSEEECDAFKSVFKVSIELAYVTETKYYDDVRENLSCRVCADCNMDDPHWVAQDFCVVVCEKCVGFHRKLGAHYSRVFSLLLDITKCDPDTIKFLKLAGNCKANKIWEANLYKFPGTKIDYNSSTSQRNKFITQKYVRKAFFAPHKFQENLADLHKEVIRLLQQNNLEDSLDDLLSALFSGADFSNEEISKCLDDLSDDYQYFATSLRSISEKYHTTKESKKVAYEMSGTLMVRVQSDPLIDMFCIMNDQELVLYDAEDKERVIISKTTGCFDATESKYRFKIIFGDISCLGYITQEIRSGGEKMMGFEVYTREERLKFTFLFKSLNADRPMWTLPLICTFAPSQLFPIIDDNISSLSRVGFLKIYSSQENFWSPDFFILNEKNLIRMPSSAVDTVEIWDLRKLSQVKLVKSVEAESINQNSSEVLTIILPGIVRDLKGLTTVESRAWHDDICRNAKTPSWRLQDQQLTLHDIPRIVENCINFLTSRGLDTEGIYRKPGTESKTASLLDGFYQDAQSVKLGDNDSIPEVANCLKRFFRKLDEPLLTKILSQKYIEVSALEDDDTRLAIYRSMMEQHPAVYKETLRRLMGHLVRVTEYEESNRMPASNLAKIFLPSLVGDSPYYSFNANIVKMVEDFITHYKYIFNLSEEDFEQERKVDISISKFTDKQVSARTTRLEIKLKIETASGNPMHEKDEVACLIIDDSWNVCDCVRKIANDRGLFAPDYVLIKNRFNDQIKRLLPYDENPAFGPSNIKHEVLDADPTCNITFENANFWIKLYKMPKSLGTLSNIVLYSCDGSSFTRKPLSIRDNLICLHHKHDIKMAASPKISWNISNLKIFKGVVDKSRNKRLGITIKPFATASFHSFAFDLQEDRDRWLFTLLEMRHPGGTLPKDCFESGIVVRHMSFSTDEQIYDSFENSGELMESTSHWTPFNSMFIELKHSVTQIKKAQQHFK